LQQAGHRSADGVVRSAERFRQGKEIARPAPETQCVFWPPAKAGDGGEAGAGGVGLRGVASGIARTASGGCWRGDPSGAPGARVPKQSRFGPVFALSVGLYVVRASADGCGQRMKKLHRAFDEMLADWFAH
jgi:hypothetical protein